MSPRARSITPSPRVGVLTPSGSTRASSVSTSNRNPPHRTSYQMQLAQGHEREGALHRESRRSDPSVPSPTASPRFPTPTPSFQRPSSVQSNHHQHHNQYDDRRAASPAPRQRSPHRHYGRYDEYSRQQEQTFQETFHEAQYPSQSVRPSYDELPPTNSQRPPGPYHRTQYTVEPTPPPSQPVRRTFTPVEAPQPPRTKTSSKATVEIFNKLLQLEHDVGNLRSEILHIRDSSHDVKTGLRALPTREEMRDEMRDIMTSTLQETTATLTSSLTESLATSLATNLSTSLSAGITESVTQALGASVTEAVEKATRTSNQSLPAITAHLVCEKTKAALGDSEKAIDASVRSALKSFQPQMLAPPGGTMATLLRPINELRAAFENSGVAESMRFVAGVTDQISTKIAQLQVATLEAVQSRADQASATMILNVLNGVEKQIEAVDASLAGLARDAASIRNVDGSLQALEASVGDIRTSTEHLVTIEERLGEIQQGGERNTTIMAGHADTLQRMDAGMQSLATSCAAIPQVGEHVRAHQAGLSSHAQAHVLAKVAEDLAELKTCGTLLGPMSTRLEALSSGEESAQAQRRRIGEQLQRLEAIESGVQSIKDGSGVLWNMDRTLADIKATLSRGQQAPTRADVDALKRAFEALGQGRARTLETPSNPQGSFGAGNGAGPGHRNSNGGIVDLPRNSSQSPRSTGAEAHAGTQLSIADSHDHDNPDQRATDSLATNDASAFGGAMATLGANSVVPNSQAPASQASAAADSTGSDSNASYSSSAVISSAPSTESALRLLSVVASQVSSSATWQKRSSSSTVATSLGSTASSTQADRHAPQAATTTAGYGTPNTSSSPVGPSTPPAVINNHADAEPAAPTSPSAAAVALADAATSSDVAAEDITTKLPKKSKRRQKWKEARRGSRRSPRIQARDDAKEGEQPQHGGENAAAAQLTQQTSTDQATARGDDANRSSSAPATQLSTTTDTDARLTLNAWLSGRKRKSQSEPDFRPGKRTTNNGLSGLLYGAGEAAGSRGRASSAGDQEGGQGSSRLWSWWHS